MNDRSDFLRILFLTFCKHALVSILTVLLYISLGRFFQGLSADGMLICLFVTNCTAIIIGKMNRILERFSQVENQDASHNSK